MFKDIKSSYFALGLVAVLIVYFAAIPIKLSQARIQSPQPQLILVLGGGEPREAAAAQFSAQHPQLEIWISSGQQPAISIEIFQQAGIDRHRLHFDHQAVDTVTNFTTTVGQLQQKNIRHIYLVTSDFHMRRAKAIAFLALGSRGIAYTPIALASKTTSEPLIKVARDVGRSLLWLVTGKTGACAKSLSI